ncbi:ubiquitin-like modifier-activating enzyme 6 isoform X1 [Mytilus galloprovincialis]|uniref:ubiquitin-like modifier-activating enzyme 6 isoform X1 n=1 Tax=Mytilus galloprovincialis TaxID=29158 RepID=UPI003F7CCCAE
MATEMEIDDSLYSRQRYVLGDHAMKKMASSSVLVYGMGGVGIEIAKNIVLAGVKALTVQDGNVSTIQDLGTQFFLREDDVKQQRNRAEASVNRLSELNPYVSMNILTYSLEDSTDLDYLKQYQCIVLTELPLTLQLKINKFCREQSPQITFISCDVYGVFCSAFCDFGDSFEVTDINGEEPRDIFIESISKDNPALVTILQVREKTHGLEDGDVVTFREVNGMTEINEKQFKISVKSPESFTINCDTSSDEFSPYTHGGRAVQIKGQVTLKYESLEKQLYDPKILICDLSKFEAPSSIHLGFMALHKFRKENNRLPNIWCKTDAEVVLSLAKQLNEQMVTRVDSLDEDLIRMISYTCRGCFAPLCAAIGGFVAQEGLKALTGKFTPLNQMIYLDSIDVITKEDRLNPLLFQSKNDRYDLLRICIGENGCRKLSQVKLFMVGCGAIGCEMLKNYALLGVGSDGKITITDNDLIEKSNLNRQFLFRPHHIRQPKSTTAAQSVLEINPDLKIEPQQYKVCPQTEESNYPDSFFEYQDLIVNALDNVEARRYVDSRCVTNQRPLLESGTMGTKGHVQVIVPHITESYGSQRDPVDEDVPYCTLKSFPATIEHCIQWARDKFESSFVQKPSMFNKFWSKNKDAQDVIEKLLDGSSIDGGVQVSKILHNRSAAWSDCIKLGRLKFEKYFNHRAKQLLHHFPLDTKQSDGSLFWQSPKRPPVPQEFDVANENHMSFVISTARLYGHAANIAQSSQDTSTEAVIKILHSVVVPSFRPSSKRIVTDESASKPLDEGPADGDEYQDAANRIQRVINQSKSPNEVTSVMAVADFEKDDDTNGHIDFITAAANLRASMYGIECSDRLKVKRIAGRIVPAIATTTAAVAGLVSVELLKVLDMKQPIEVYKNCFLNLALPVLLLSEPGPVEKTVLKEGLTVTMWDKWEVKGNKTFVLQQFLQHFKDVYGFEATMVGHGVKMVYVPFMPGHSKRLNQTMEKLLKPHPGQKYADLVVCLQGDNEEDIEGPPIRYYFGL